eukprot:SAG31_NODE_1669_length_7575_cov_2.213483_1_plen_997_part_00
MAGCGASTYSSGLSAGWLQQRGVLSAEWIGTLTPKGTATYRFNCTFLNGFGLAWIDGHIFCNHGLPAYRHQVGPSNILLLAGKGYSVKMQYLKNSTELADASASLLWSKDEAPAALQEIPAAALSDKLPTAAHQKLASLQQDQYARSAGWGSWFPYNLLQVSRLPDGAQLVFGLCQLDTGSCELISRDSANAIRLGAHAADGSYAQLYYRYGGSSWDGGVNISVVWGTEPAVDDCALADLRMTVAGVDCGNCSNWAVVFLPGYISESWGRSGTVSVDSRKNSIIFSPAGDLATSVIQVHGSQISHANISSTIPHLAFAISANSTLTLTSVPQEAPETTQAQLAGAEAAGRKLYDSYETPQLIELKEAIQASVMWLTVYTPYAAGLMLTLARSSMGGGDSQCDWDNFFAAMMQASDNRGRDLGFATFAQELGSKTIQGFVPNGSNGAKKSRDRTEPIVGAKVLLQMLKRFGIMQTGWLVEWAFDQLYGWHDWAWRRRRLAPLNLIAPGSDPIPRADSSDWGVNSMQGARWETGMDNSPMYDGPDGSSDNKTGPVLFNTSDHLMQIYDVGMSANLASDMLALVDLGKALCTAPLAANLSDCSITPAAGDSSTLTKIATLQHRSVTLSKLIEQHLWDEDTKAFVNKLPGRSYSLARDVFYRRMSPTSFYPLMTGQPTEEQAEELATHHLLNSERFCITPKESWPPAERKDGNNTVLLQTWQKNRQEVVCGANSVGTSPHDESFAPGSCHWWQDQGYSLVRNESVGWSNDSIEATRVPLFPFRLGQQTVLGRASDFLARNQLSSSPVVWISKSIPQPGAWPLQLWRGTPAASLRNSSAMALHETDTNAATLWRVVGSPSGNVAINNDQRGTIQWQVNATLGWALSVPRACYWGLPSVSFDDPAFATPGGFVYWRGNAWAPLAMLVYWSLDHPRYANVSAVQIARKGLAHSYATMWMESAWRPSHTVCENYCEHARGGCCGDTFYHWGALAGFMSILEAGK